MSQSNGHGAAALEREVDAQRARVESRIDEIKERLTPGQLVDELLSHTKTGGAEFATNLGQTVSANPLPAALLGISLAWLMAGPKASSASPSPHHQAPRPGYSALRGTSLQRTSHARDTASGLWYSEFTDDAGIRYRARSDESGKRMGHFVDDAGKSFAGFFDEAGNRIEEFRDEAGGVIEGAMGWADHAWHDVVASTRQGYENLVDSAAQATSEVRHQVSDYSRDAMRLLHDQPLIMGALAFAAGAALGAVAPRTSQEDALLGETADKLKHEAGHLAAKLYEDGKDKAAEVYADLSETAGGVYEDTTQKLAGNDVQAVR